MEQRNTKREKEKNLQKMKLALRRKAMIDANKKKKKSQTVKGLVV